MGIGMEERAALVALLRSRPEGATWLELTAKVIEAGSASDVLRGLDLSLIPDPAVENAYAEALRQLEEWDGSGLQMVTVLDHAYPERLLGIHQAPAFLFVQGELRRDDPAVSVVGSRKASQRGMEVARAVAGALAGEGVTVVAGLAAGIDTAAHTAALDAGGRTVAVLGTGIRRFYPAENRELQLRIADRGMVMSQFLPDAPPQKHTFPMRNATMSGYGIATVVVEAGEHSGARIQARVAVEHGRPVILTTMVVEQTEWAKALVGRPGVHVAEGTKHVVEIVRSLREEASAVEAVLKHLSGV